MSYTNSPLVNYTKLSPNNSGQRTHVIDRITPHCVVGQASVETLGESFYSKSRQASSNYGIGTDGRVGMYVEEKNRSWCSGSRENDQRSVTIECASDNFPPYAFKDIVYNKLIDLCVDICKRNGKTKLIWFGDQAKSLAYTPSSNEMVLTVHRWFQATQCPGDWMYARMGDLANKVTERLGTFPVVSEESKKDVLTIAKEVISGKWGNGDARKSALTSAGYSYSEVQSKVNELLNGSAVKPSTSTQPQTQTTTKEVTATAKAQKFDKGLEKTFKTTADLYMRDNAGKNHKALCIIPKGTAVQCYGYYSLSGNTKWYYIQVSIDGVKYTGFSSSAYLK